MTRRSALIATAAMLLTAGGALAAEAAKPAPQARFALDATGPLFTATNLRPGDRVSACTTVANAGAAPGRSALYATGPRGALAPYLRLTVARGTSCDAGEVVYDGTLAAFPSTPSAAVADPTAQQPGDRTAYRFALTLGDDPAAAGRSAAWDWHLAVESLPGSAPRAAVAASSGRATGCDAVRVTRGRTLTKTVRISRGVRAALVVRVSTSGAARLSTGLRVRDGRTLVLPRWARVRYRLNGRTTATSTRRPFRVTVRAAWFIPGRNRIAVAVQPRRGRKRTTAFTLTTKTTTTGGRTTCVLG